jgi:adenosylcobinamide kinase/adenosylcobinamide-phosphate guanylyltransferase
MKRGKLILYLGGIRSGKSRLAQERLESLVKDGPVVYLATARPNRRDPELTRRIADHRRQRPVHWEVLEGWSSLLQTLKKLSKRRQKGLLLDGLGMHLASRLRDPEEAVMDDLEVFAKGCRHQAAWTLVTADEVGLGGVSGHPASRRFADLNGKANQVLAAAADEVWWVAAGITTRIKPGHAGN